LSFEQMKWTLSFRNWYTWSVFMSEVEVLCLKSRDSWNDSMVGRKRSFV